MEITDALRRDLKRDLESCRSQGLIVSVLYGVTNMVFSFALSMRAFWHLVALGFRNEVRDRDVEVDGFRWSLTGSPISPEPEERSVFLGRVFSMFFGLYLLPPLSGGSDFFIGWLVFVNVAALIADPVHAFVPGGDG